MSGFKAGDWVEFSGTAKVAYSSKHDSGWVRVMLPDSGYHFNLPLDEVSVCKVKCPEPEGLGAVVKASFGAAGPIHHWVRTHNLDTPWEGKFGEMAAWNSLRDVTVIYEGVPQ